VNGYELIARLMHLSAENLEKTVVDDCAQEIDYIKTEWNDQIMLCGVLTSKES
jgi:hypothetical protein